MKILHYYFLRPPIPICVIRSFRKQCALLSPVAHLPNTLLQTFVLDRFRALTIRVHIQSTILFEFHESLDNLTPRDVYLGQGEKIKRIRETIKQNSINKRIFEHKRMKLQHK